MRTFVLPVAVAAALLLAGCGGPSSAPGSTNVTPANADASASAITGTVSLDPPRTLSGQARLDLSLVDMSVQPQVAIASKTVMPVGALPLQFSLEFNPQQINPQDLYVVRATMEDGDRHFDTAIAYPVLTKGQPRTVAIQLHAEPTVGDKALAGFEALKSRIGGMKYTEGSAATETVSRGWQTFRDAKGDIRFIREREDAGDKGYTRTDFAYLDGKPWVVVQERLVSSAARKPESVARAGWDAQGNLILHRHLVAGANSTLGTDQAQALYSDAEAMLKQVGAGRK